jgi:hypothetical protein
MASGPRVTGLQRCPPAPPARDECVDWNWLTAWVQDFKLVEPDHDLEGTEALVLDEEQRV